VQDGAETDDLSGVCLLGANLTDLQSGISRHMTHCVLLHFALPRVGSNSSFISQGRESLCNVEHIPL
jgi:hypothetical protein